MKLGAIAKTLPPVPVRLKLPGDLHAAPGQYAKHKRQEQGAGLEVPDLVVEMVRAFVASDRDFRAWQRNGQGQVAGASGSRGTAE
jgi:hypothetical protein